MNKSFIGKKLLSLLLSVLMCLSLIPTVAFATTVEGETEGSTIAENYTVDENGNVAIYTEDGLFWFAEQVNSGDTFSGKTVTLENNIALTKAWTPIGYRKKDGFSGEKPFKGIFNGNNHVISGFELTDNSPYNDGIGFFGKAYVATIKNLTVEGNITAVGDYVGGIVGHGYATIENCVFKGNISGDAMQVGGIAGSGGFTITNCSVYGNIHANTLAGGIVGNCQDGGAYKGCYVEGEISSDNTYWGGGAAGITPVPLYPMQVISGCYSNTVVKVAGEEVNCPIIATYNNSLNYDGYTGDIKIYDNSWNKQKNSNDSYPLYAEENGVGGVLMEGKDVARDNNLVMIEDDLNYITGNLKDVRIMNGSKITGEQIEGKAVAEVNGAKYATLKETVTAAKDGETVTLLADTKEDITIANSITLDLGGKTLTNTGAGKATISITVNNVTVKNGNVIGGASYYNIEVQKGAAATLEGVTATAGNIGSSMIDNWGTLTINSGTYTGGLNTVKSEEDSTLTITGGTFTLEKGTSEGFTGVIFNYGKLEISGGTFIQGDTSVPYGQAQVIHTDKSGSSSPSTVITGGTFKNLCSRSAALTVRETNPAAGSTKVSGGTFNKKILEEYCADGFIPTNNADDTYGVKAGSYVAQIGNKKYETLADAIRLATKGKTITLLKDITVIGSTTTVPAVKKITIDLNGFTLNGTNTSINAQALLVKGNLTLTDSVGTGKICSSYTGTSGRVISVEENGTLIINGVTVTTEGMANAGNAIYVAGKAKLVLNSGTVKADFKRGNYAIRIMSATAAFEMNGGEIIAEGSDSETYITALGGQANSSIAITGGKITAPKANAILARNSNIIITGGDFSGKIEAKKGSISGGTFSSAVPADYCADGFIPKDNGNGTYGVKKGKYVAEVDGDNYETLEEAYANADDGATITLLADCSSDRINLEDKSITLVLNGYTVTSTAAYGVLFCVKNGNTITIDGTVAGSKVVGTIMITGDTYGHIAINGGTYENAQYCPIYVNGAVSNDESTVTITNAVITALNGNSDQDNGVAVYLAGYATSTFTNCTITAPVTGIEIRAGKLDLINCNVTGGSGEITTSANGNGTTVTNVAVAVSQHTTKKAIGLNITGGTYTGTAAVYQTNVQGTGSEGVKVKITDGMFKGLINADTANAVAISGGTFDRAVPADYCADGFIPKNNGDGTYGVTLKPTVTETKKLTVTIGNGKVSYTINSGLKDIWYESFKNNLYESGTHFTVEATPDENYKFLYWINKEGRILSDNPIYSFYLNDNVTIEAVFYKTTVSTAYVVFKDRWNSVLASGRADADGTISVPAVKAYNGYKFIGWFDEGDNQYTVTDGKIKVSVSCNVFAKYEIDSDKLYTVKVDGEIYGKYKYNDLVKVEAKDRKSEGLYFNGWYVGDMLVCYDNVYYFYISGNIALTAKYSDKAIESKPLVSLIVNERNTVSETEQSLLLTAAWYIDSKYKVTAAGILYTFEDGKDLTIEAADGDDDITRTDSIPKNNNDLLGNNASYRYTLKLNGSNTTKTVYAVAYVTYVDDSGNSVTIYTTVQISAA